MKRMMIFIGTILVILITGCSSQQNESVATVRQILELAKADKVTGKMKVHLNGGVEAGFKETFYCGSPGSVVDADLAFRVEDVEKQATNDTNGHE
jgi:hypothetical protein